MANIPLINRKGEQVGAAQIDDADALVVSRYNWYLIKNSGEVMATVSANTQVRLWRFLLFGHDQLDVEVDHINGDRCDNRRSNLRVVTHAQNMQNRKLNKNNRSGARGVYWDKRLQRWVAAVRHNGKKIRKFCLDKESAVLAALELRRMYMPYAVERS